MKLGPAYRIETKRLVIRCYDPNDVFLLQDIIQRNLDHLLPWIPWLRREPEELSAKIERLRMFRADFDLDKCYIYGIFNHEEDILIGGMRFDPKISPDAFDVGYWIDKDQINHGYATEATAALIKVAFEIENVRRVEIHCEPGNIRSVIIPKKISFTHEATLRNRIENFKGELVDSMIWSIINEEYLKSTLPKADITAVDVLGNKIL